MTIKASTGLRNEILASSALRDALSLGFVKIYAGTVPATADAALGGATLLCTISVGSSGTGVTFDSGASGGVMTKAPGETWSGTNAATGVASFYRHIAPGDDGTSSTSQIRIQGEVGVAGADMNMSSTSLTIGATQTIDFYSVAFPSF